MGALKKRMSMDQDEFIKMPVPAIFGRQVEIIILSI